MNLLMQGIEKSFGKNHVLKGVDFEVKTGEIHALVGENGAELLTMNGGVATVQPINNNNTTNLGGLNLSVYGAPGQNVNELAEVVMDRIQSAVNSKGAVWA